MVVVCKNLEAGFFQVLSVVHQSLLANAIWLVVHVYLKAVFVIELRIASHEHLLEI